MKNTEYYKLLGVKSDASADELKRAYRKLARKYHPDVSKAEDAEARFKEMKEAYDCLKDPDSRAAYDHFGEHWKAALEAGVEPGQTGSSGPGEPFSANEHTYAQGSGSFDFSDIFGSVFAEEHDDPLHRAYRSYSSRGEDVQARMEISIQESFHGASKQIEFSVMEFGDDGRPQSVRRKLEVKIPSGIVSGQRIRLTGQGHAGYPDGVNGDLYVQISFAPNAIYEVRGRDVYSKLTIAPWQAALGASVAVETLGGIVNARVPLASSSGKVLRLGGRGLPGKVKGDHYVELVINMEGAKSEQVRALYEQLRELETETSTHGA